ncbi:MAG: LysR family transcriptional regulator [Chthoniobacterales bacterium]
MSRDWLPEMNVHHLELFYYVAKHGGITEAVRKIPYGIQQPAISSQLIRLEEDLGLKLFQRRPFHLTPAGEELYDYVRPFFGGLADTRSQLRGEANGRLRLAAPATILREHLPKLLEDQRKQFPGLKLQLHDANQAEAEVLLRKQEIDLAITDLESRPSAGICCSVLLKVPLVLLLPKQRRLRSGKKFWSEIIQEPLISLPPNEAICRLFRQGLSKLKQDWPTSVELSSLDLIPVYVRSGFGVGLFLAEPQGKAPAGTRVHLLTDFPPLVVAALWQGKLPDLASDFLRRISTEAKIIGATKTG